MVTESTLSDDTRLEILYDHYKETCSGLQDERQRRYHLLFLILVVLTVMSFLVYSPIQAAQVLSEWVTGRLELTTPLDFSFVGTGIWFTLMALVVRYFQVVISVERRYNHIHELEKQLCQHFGYEVFTREGKAYLGDYPQYLGFAHWVYVVVIPFALVVIAVAKIVRDWQGLSSTPLLIGLNFLACGVVVMSVVLYWKFNLTKARLPLRRRRSATLPGT